MKKLIPYILVLVIALISSISFYIPGYIPTHDGEYHIIRLWQFDKNITDGVLFPLWAPDLHNGFGLPIFEFFYPFPHYISIIFHSIGFSYIESIKLSLGTSIIISAISFFLYTREFVGKFSSIVATSMYIFAPYHSLVVSVRGSVGEAWIFAIIPFVFLLITKLVKSSKQRWFIWLLLTSCILSSLMLIHNLLGAVFFIISFCYGLFFSIIQKKSILNIIIVYLLSIGISTYYWLPIIIESKFINGISIINPFDHFVSIFQLIFPSWGTGFSVPGISDGISFQIGIVHFFAIIVSLFLTLFFRNKLIIFFLFVTLISLFLTLEESKFIWEAFSPLQLLQYPWRLLSIVVFCSSVITGLLINKHNFIGTLVLLLCFISYFSYSFPVRYESRSDSYFLENPDWTTKSSTLGDSFSTIWSEKYNIDNEFNIINGDATINSSIRTSIESQSVIEAQNNTSVVIKRSYFPGWKIYNNNKIQTYSNYHGAITFNLSKGTHSILVKYESSNIRIIGYTITIFSIMLFILIPNKLYEYSH